MGSNIRVRTFLQQLLCPQHAVKMEGFDATDIDDPLSRLDSRDLDVAPDGGRGSGGPSGPGLGDGPMRFGAPLNGRSTSTNSRS